jgi:hypothetical protein
MLKGGGDRRVFIGGEACHMLEKVDNGLKFLFTLSLNSSMYYYSTILRLQVEHSV